LIIPNQALSLEEMKENVEGFNKLFGFRTETIDGNFEMLIKTWKTAKRQFCAKGEE
jgi:hypothetical protein